MNLEKFVTVTDLISKLEIEKVVLLAFFFSQTEGVEEFSLSDVERWFLQLKLHKLNLSRLKVKIRQSRQIVKSKTNDHYCLHISKQNELLALFPGLQKSEQIEVLDDGVLPKILYGSTRGYIEIIGDQINACYSHNLFDGCAVLMRRLIEILLIHSYENLAIESQIKNAHGNYRQLSEIVDLSITNSRLALSRNSKEALEDFRTLRNFSAHKIYYTAKRKDVKNVILNFRATIEELLYKSGLKI